MRRFLVAAVAVGALSAWPADARAQTVTVEGPAVFLKDVPFALALTVSGSLEPTAVRVELGDGTVVADTVIAPFGELILADVTVQRKQQAPLAVITATERIELARPVLPGLVSILPPLVAIALALIFREVVTSLFAGIWLGCVFLAGYNPLAAIFMAGNEFARGELADADNAAVVLFSLLLGGMVGVVTRMGGTRAIVDAVAGVATTRIRGQVATWMAGLAVFFDDYSNSLIVGNTMRPLTDRLKISREKLAYIVDSTAAPVAAVFFVSTWIGYEVGLIDDGLELAAAQHAADPVLVAQLANVSGFGVFLQTIPYLFYPLLALAMVMLVAATGRDFGPMWAAERRAFSGGGLARPGAQLAADLGSHLKEAPNVPPGRWWNGVVPVVVLVLTVLIGLITTGIDALGVDEPRTIRNIFRNPDPFSPLMWGALLACVTAIGLGVSQRIVGMRDAMDAWLTGLRAMLLAIVILVMAWSLGAVTQSLNTAGYLAQVLSDSLPAVLFPSLVFVTAALMAFATGTSWATMAILLPLVVPLSITLAGGVDFGGGAERAIVLGGIGSVLAGAILGDHCSPISDTTVLSSTASSCDHVDHVRTQLPYAILVGVVAVVVGSVPSALGVSPWICLAVGIAVIWGVLRWFGRPVDAGEVASG